MLKGNEINNPNSDASFELIVSEARSSHQRSKDGAMEAAANAYMLWLRTQSSCKEATGTCEKFRFGKVT